MIIEILEKVSMPVVITGELGVSTRKACWGGMRNTYWARPQTIAKLAGRASTASGQSLRMKIP